MARGVNKVILIGNLGQDPDVRFTANGSAVANLSVATSESWRDQATQQMQEKTEWHRVVIFGKSAEFAQQYLHKGSKVYIEGKIQTRKWQDQQGQDRYTTEVVVNPFGGQLQSLDGRQEGMGAPAGGGEFQPRAAQQSAPQQQYGSAPQQPMQQQAPAAAPQQQYGGAPQQQQPQSRPAPQQQQPQSRPAPQQQPQQQPQAVPAAEFDDFDDDIPF